MQSKVVEDLKCIDKGEGRFACPDTHGPTWCNNQKCECIFGYHLVEIKVPTITATDDEHTVEGEETQTRCVPCKNDKTSYGNEGDTCKFGKGASKRLHWMCSTGYCAKATKQCTKRIEDGKQAERRTRAGNEIGRGYTKQSCISGEQVCGVCGKGAKDGAECFRNHDCGQDSYCKVTVKEGSTSKVRKPRICGTSTCHKCPTRCGTGDEPRGCHWPIDSFGKRTEDDLRCGKLSTSEKFADLGQRIKKHLKGWGKCFKQILTRDVTVNEEDSNVQSQTTHDDAEGAQTCASRERNTGQRYPRMGKCKVDGPVRKKKDPNKHGGFCFCTHGNYWDEDEYACVPCPDGEDPGNNDGDECSTNEDCSSGKCRGNTLKDKRTGSAHGHCVPNEDSCKDHIKAAASLKTCNWGKCDITIGEPCLGLDRFVNFVKNGIKIKPGWEKEIEDKDTDKWTVSGNAELSVDVDGSVDVAGYAEANLLLQRKKARTEQEKKKQVTARLKDVKLEVDAKIDLTATGEFQGTIKEKKIPLTSKQHLYMNAFMAGPVPVVVHIWCQPVVYVSFNAFIKAESKAEITWNGTLAFEEDPEIMVDLRTLKRAMRRQETETSSVITTGFTEKNIKRTGDDPKVYWNT